MLDAKYLSSSYFFHFSGIYNIYVKGDKGENHVGKCDNTGSFGELALMYNMPRAATIQVKPHMKTNLSFHSSSFRTTFYISNTRKLVFREGIMNLVNLLPLVFELIVECH